MTGVHGTGAGALQPVDPRADVFAFGAVLYADWPLHSVAQEQAAFR
jgi:hypothetical protein